MKKVNKSQTTIFIIFGVVIICLALFFIFIGSKSNQARLGEDSLTTNGQVFDTGIINNYVEECLKDVTKKGIEVVSKQGGYYKKDVKNNFYIFYHIPYYFYDNQSHYPELYDIENELSKYIDDYLKVCVDDFKIYEDTGFEFEDGKVNSDVMILDDEIKIIIDYDVTISSDEKTVNIEEFSTKVDSYLKNAYENSVKIIKEHEKYPKYIPVGYAMELARDNGFYFETINIENGDVIFTLIYDKDSNKPYVYAFVIDYPGRVENNLNKSIGEMENETK